jgi:flagellum-specific peptidoglycan hydrolase FlgJ
MKHSTFDWIATAMIVSTVLVMSTTMSVCSETWNSPVVDTTAVDTVPMTELEMSKDNFFSVCEMLSIKHPEVVYAQARLESGNFTSSHYVKRNNFLGIYDSRNHRYMSFEHWTDCLVAYRDKVQYRYKRNADRNDYMNWLVEIGYAEDPDYINKIKRMVK